MRSPSSSEAGFTLIELLVALSVFAIAALALVRLDALALRTAGELGARELANLTVQNEAVLVKTDSAPLVRGTTRRRVENGGRIFTVIRRVEPTADGRLARIELVAVDDRANGRAAMTIVKRVG